jgi:hypothetical protein
MQSLRHLLYKNIVQNKDFGLGVETDFDFKYIPSYNLGTSGGHHEKSGLMVKGVERRNLITLVLGGVFASGICLVWARGVMGMIRW